MDQTRHIEMLEVIAGTRGNRESRPDQAVRIKHLAPLLQIPTTFNATKAAGSTPTKAEFDALVEENRVLHARLVEIAATLQTILLK